MVSDLAWEVTMELDGAIGEGVVFLESFRDLPDPLDSHLKCTG
jgi:hypothetical protein